MIHKETGLPLADAILKAKVKLTLKAPFFAFYVNRSNVEIGDRLGQFRVKTATTNGNRIVMNPRYCSELSMSELVFLLAHEGAHIGASHPLRAARILNKTPELYNRHLINVAADLLINHGLNDEGFKLTEKSLINPEFNPVDYTFESLYKKILDEANDPDPDQSGFGEGDDSDEGEESESDEGSDTNEDEDRDEDSDSDSDEDKDKDEGEDSDSGSDSDSDEDKDEDESDSNPESGNELSEGSEGTSEDHQYGGFVEATSEDGHNLTTDEIEQELKRAGVELRQAVQAAKAAGKESGFGKGVVEEICPSHVNWRDKLREFTGRAIIRDDYTWRRPNPRYNAFPDTYLPSLGRPGLKNLVIACDSSGSVSETAFSEFIQAVSEILEEHPQCDVTLIQCDSSINSVAESQGYIDTSQIKRHGFGGTDFKPVFEYIEESADSEPDCLLYFTDLWVGDWAFPKIHPSYPVLWLYARDNHNPHYTDRANLPFGELSEYRDED